MEMMTIIVLWIFISIIAAVVIILHFSVRAYLKFDDEGFEIKVKYLFINLYPRKPKKEKIKRTKVKPQKLKNKKKKEFTDNIDDDFSSEIISENTEDINTEFEDNSDFVSESINTTIENPKNTSYDENNDKSSSIKHNEKSKRKNNKTDIKKESKFSEFKEKYYKIKPYLPMGWKYFKKLLKTIRITDLKINVEVGREDAHEAAIYYGTVQGILFNTLGELANAFTVKIRKADVNCVFVKNTIDGEGECFIRVRPSAMIAIAFCVGVNFGIVYLKQKRLRKSHETKEIKIEDKLEVQ
ncbi:MAG: hypothetical protein ACI4I7_02065 [Oscillospiraceae bacterium]